MQSPQQRWVTKPIWNLWRYPLSFQESSGGKRCSQRSLIPLLFSPETLDVQNSIFLFNRATVEYQFQIESFSGTPSQCYQVKKSIYLGMKTTLCWIDESFVATGGKRGIQSLVISERQREIFRLNIETIFFSWT